MNAAGDYYTILGVLATADAVVIRAAYRALSQRYHPDKAAPNDKREAGRRMSEINEAYAVLGDATLRAAYDASRPIGDERAASDATEAPRRPRMRLNPTVAGRIAYIGVMLLAFMIAAAVGVEEKSNLKIAWEYISGGFAGPSHYIYHWPTILGTLGCGWLIARWARRYVARVMQ